MKHTDNEKWVPLILCCTYSQLKIRIQKTYRNGKKYCLTIKMENKHDPHLLRSDLLLFLSWIYLASSFALLYISHKNNRNTTYSDNNRRVIRKIKSKKWSLNCLHLWRPVIKQQMEIVECFRTLEKNNTHDQILSVIRFVLDLPRLLKLWRLGTLSRIHARTYTQQLLQLERKCTMYV